MSWAGCGVLWTGEEDECIDTGRTREMDSPTWTEVVAPDDDDDDDDDDDGGDEWGAIALELGVVGREMAGVADLYYVSAHTARATLLTSTIIRNIISTSPRTPSLPGVKYIELCSTGMLKAIKQLRKAGEYESRIVSFKRAQRVVTNVSLCSRTSKSDSSVGSA